MNVDWVPISKVRPHPRNYRSHPEDQIRHLVASLRQNKFYRPVVVANDFTILAGHGIVQAAHQVPLAEIPIVQIDVSPDSPEALRIVTGDNELGRLAESDDRALSDLLRELTQNDTDGLLGTGYDEMMLANLVMVTRTADEIPAYEHALEWVGLPEFADENRPPDGIKVIITCDDTGARDDLFKRLGQPRVTKEYNDKPLISLRWPPREYAPKGGEKFRERSVEQ